LVLYVVDTLGLPESGFGVFLVSFGVGGLLGGLAAARIAAKLGRIATLVLSSAVTGGAAIGIGLTSNVWVGAALFGTVASSVSVFNVLVISLRQALIPDQSADRRGRRKAHQRSDHVRHLRCPADGLGDPLVAAVAPASRPDRSRAPARSRTGRGELSLRLTR
jgi:hypothetical protein